MTSGNAAAGSPLAAAYAHCFALARAEDRDRWLASLFWPAAARPHIHALLAFDAEIARIADTVSEPMLGEIRHQWWRDAIAKGEHAGNPVAMALVDTIARFNLDTARLLALIEARAFDLYDDPMPNEAALEAYLRDTSSTLFEAFARVLAPGHLPPPCVDAAGRAYGLTGLLRGLPYQVMKQQVFLPSDLLAASGATPDDVLAHTPTQGLAKALAALRARARMHLGEMQVGLHEAGPARAACLPAMLCEPYLRANEQARVRPLLPQARDLVVAAPMGAVACCATALRSGREWVGGP